MAQDPLTENDKVDMDAYYADQDEARARAEGRGPEPEEQRIDVLLHEGEPLLKAGDLAHSLRVMAAGFREHEALGASPFLAIPTLETLADQFAQLVVDTKAQAQ